MPDAAQNTSPGRALGIPAVLLAAFTIACWIWPIDRTVAAWFYTGDGHWLLEDERWVDILYHYGPTPSVVLGIGGLLAWFFCKAHPWLARRWRMFAFLGLSIALGAGVLVNFGFKDHYGRPRPKQTVEFGGDQAYAKLLIEPRHAPTSRSFPSGHAAAGFSLMSLFFLLRRTRHQRLGRIFLLLALFSGAVVGLARMATGSHWISDIVWAAGVVYFFTWAMAAGFKPWLSLEPEAKE